MFTASGRTFTAAEQAQAWNACIEQDAYLRKHRGESGCRGAVLLPMLHRVDLGVSQELSRNLAGRRHRLEVRADIVNFGNLLNSNWGVGQRLISNQPLTNAGVHAAGRSTYRLCVINDELLARSLKPPASPGGLAHAGHALLHVLSCELFQRGWTSSHRYR